MGDVANSVAPVALLGIGMDLKCEQIKYDNKNNRLVIKKNGKIYKIYFEAGELKLPTTFVTGKEFAKIAAMQSTKHGIDGLRLAFMLNIVCR